MRIVMRHCRNVSPTGGLHFGLFAGVASVRPLEHVGKLEADGGAILAPPSASSRCTVPFFTLQPSDWHLISLLEHIHTYIDMMTHGY